MWVTDGLFARRGWRCERRAGHHGNNDLGAGETAAGNVAGEGLDVGNDHGAGLLPGSAAYSAAISDAKAGGRPLEGPQNKFLAFSDSIPNDIKPHPEKLHPFIDDGGGFGHARHRVGLIPQKRGKILIQTEILENPCRQMAVAVRILIQIQLMPFLCFEKAPQRLQFNRQRLPDTGLDGRVNSLKHRQIGRIGVVDAGTVSGALIMPLPIKAEGIDDAEIEVCKGLEGDALRPIAHPYGLRETGGVGIDLLV